MNLLFWRKKTPKPPKPPKPRDKWEDVMDKYPVGKKFNHLGVEVVVRSSLCSIDAHNWYEPGELIVEYVDSLGAIRTHRFIEQQTDYLLSLP